MILASQEPVSFPDIPSLGLQQVAVLAMNAVNVRYPHIHAVL